MAAVTPAEPLPEPSGREERRRAAEASIRRKMEQAGYRKDPLGYAYEAALELLGEIYASADEVRAAAHTERLERLAGTVEHQVAQAVERIASTSVTAVDRRAARLARTHNLRTLLIAAGVLVGAMIASLGAGYWVGWSRANDTARSADARLASFFADGAAGAATWLNLAGWNDISLALAECNRTNSGIQQGRRMCAVPLWLGPPKR